jgi:hypothetical protein
MQTMRNTTVIKIEAARDARRRLRTASERRVQPRRGGRVWVNGGELGGVRAAHAHLADSYD